VVVALATNKLEAEPGIEGRGSVRNMSRIVHFS
jgi:hypothetical protein